MSYYRDFLDWAAKGLSVPVIEATWEWLVAHQPDETGRRGAELGRQPDRQHHLGRLPVRRRARLGDGVARPARDGPRLVALLRPPVHRAASACPARPASPRTRRPSSATASSSAGPMQDLFFYEIFSGFRFAVVMLPAVGPRSSGPRSCRPRRTWRRTTSPPSSWPRCWTSSRPLSADGRSGSSSSSGPGPPRDRPRRRPPAAARPASRLPFALYGLLLPAVEDPVHVVHRRRSWRRRAPSSCCS